MTDAKQAMESVVNAHPDIKGIVCQGGHMAIGALEAFQGKGLEPPYIITDDVNLFQQWCAKNNFDKFAAVNGGSNVFYYAAEDAIKILEGQPIPKDRLEPCQLFFRDYFIENIPEGMPEGYWCLNLLPDDVRKKYWG